MCLGSEISVVAVLLYLWVYKELGINNFYAILRGQTGISFKYPKWQRHTVKLMAVVG